MLAWLIGVVLLLPATVAAGYYFVLTFLGWRSRPRSGSSVAKTNFAVVIPAHNEELGLPATLKALQVVDYPRNRLRVLVVADNCEDETAAVARRHGVEVLERHEPERRAKGYALALAIPQVLAAGADAVVILDADCEPAADLFRQFDEAFQRGTMAVQAARIPRNADDGPVAAVSAVGSEIENALSAGRSWLGIPAALRGSGMAFRRDLLERCPWDAYGLTEDAQYGAKLAAAGIPVEFLPYAVVTGEVPRDADTLARQRTRWRAAVYDRGPGRLGRWLASKPLVLAQLALTTLAVTALTLWQPSPITFALLMVNLLLLIMTGSVYIRAVRRAGVPVGWRSCRVVFRLVGVTLGGILNRQRNWERTQRIGEAVQSR